MPYKQILRFLCRVVLVSIMYVSVSNAQEPLEILQTRLAEYSSWSTTFDQSVVDESGAVLQEVSGVLDIRKPMQFYWQTQEPFAQLVISNGQTLWVYDQDLQQVIVRAMNAELAPLPVALLSGNAAQLQDLVSLDSFSTDTSAREIFELAPKQDSTTQFEKLIIAFKAGLLDTLELHDALGQVTTLTMTSQERAPRFEQARFEFSPPSGVDIIDERAQMKSE